MAGLNTVANGIGLSSGITNLISFTIASCSTLTSTIKSFSNKERAVRELRNETQELASVLETLQLSIRNTSVSMELLEGPLKRCRAACAELNSLITKSTEHSTDRHISIEDWMNLRYMGEDITGFKNMLAGYKATINIALAYENMYEAPASFYTVLTVSTTLAKQLGARKRFLMSTRNLSRLPNAISKLTCGRLRAGCNLELRGILAVTRPSSNGWKRREIVLNSV